MIVRQRILGWAIPLFCVLIAALGVIWQHSRLVNAQHELEGARGQLIDSALKAETRAGLEEGGTQVTAPGQIDGEEARFLADLREKAASANVRLTNWSATTLMQTGAQPGQQAPQTAAQAQNDVLKNVIPITSELTIDGSYPNVRKFVASIEPSQPIYTFNNLTWARTQAATELKITITRYVEAAPVAPAAVSQSADAKGVIRT